MTNAIPAALIILCVIALILLPLANGISIETRTKWAFIIFIVVFFAGLAL
jgi:hypothetical protein